jgi:hypothetical protein
LPAYMLTGKEHGRTIHYETFAPSKRGRRRAAAAQDSLDCRPMV